MKEKIEYKYITGSNGKMDFPMFGLPALKTCIGKTLLCSKYCYARKGNYSFKPAINKREFNLALTKTTAFVKAIAKEIHLTQTRFFRIHDSGDFYSQVYLNKWLNICQLFPEIQFLAFTKAFTLDFSKKPDNLNLYYSIWNDTNMSLVPETALKAYTVITYKAFKDMPLQIGNAKKCEGYCNKCLICFKGKGNVYFNIH